MSKLLIDTGHVEGFGRSFREETPRETLMREAGSVNHKEKQGLEVIANIIDKVVIPQYA